MAFLYGSNLFIERQVTSRYLLFAAFLFIITEVATKSLETGFLSELVRKESI